MQTMWKIKTCRSAWYDFVYRHAWKNKKLWCCAFANEHEQEVKFDIDWIKLKNIAVIIGNEAGFSEEEASSIIKTMANLLHSAIEY